MSLSIYDEHVIRTVSNNYTISAYLLKLLKQTELNYMKSRVVLPLERKIIFDVLFLIIRERNQLLKASSFCFRLKYKMSIKF